MNTFHLDIQPSRDQADEATVCTIPCCNHGDCEAAEREEERAERLRELEVERRFDEYMDWVRGA